jgi:hypothetical protein
MSEKFEALTTDIFSLDQSFIEEQEDKPLAISQVSGGVLVPHTIQINESLREFEQIKETEYSLLDLTTLNLSNDNAAWEMFLGAFRDRIGGESDAPGVQLLTIPQNADWNNETTGDYIAWRVLGDSIPSWGNIYKPTPAQITQGYQTFISNLFIPLPNEEDTKKADKAREEYLDAVDDLGITLSDIGIKWVAFDEAQQSLPENRRVSFDTWYARTYARKVAAREDKVRLANQKYAYWFREAAQGYEVVSDALEAFNNDAFQLEATLPSGIKQKLRTFEITPSLDDFVSESGAITDGGNPAFSFSLDKSSYRYRYEQTRWGGRASYLGGFLGSARAGGQRTSIDVSQSSFKLDFSCRNIQIFTITPGPWFSGTVIKGFKDGPWIEGGPVANGTVKLWGADGILSLLSTQIVVVYKPKFTISLSESEYSYVKTEVSASGGFSIGPFGFGASYGRTTEDISLDEATQTVTAEDKTETPQIAAILTTALPNFN